VPGEAKDPFLPHPRSVKHMQPQAEQFLMSATCPWPLTPQGLKRGSRARFRSATRTGAGSRLRPAGTSLRADLATKRKDKDREAMEVIHQGEGNG
jgi:hypothetical protein